MNYILVDLDDSQSLEQIEVNCRVVNSNLEEIENKNFILSSVDEKILEEFNRFITRDDSLIVMFEKPVFLYKLSKLYQDKAFDFEYLDLSSLFRRFCGRGRKIDRCISYFDRQYEYGSETPNEMLFHLFSCFVRHLDVDISKDTRIMSMCFYKLSDATKRFKRKEEYELNNINAKKFLDLEKIDKYIFFDLEAANELDGIAKICEFGAVVTDKNFNVLEKIFYVINPEDIFNLRSSFDDKKGIELAYSEKYYYMQKPFPDFYQKIKEILEDKSAFVMGFAVDNDVRMLATDIWSYELEQLDYFAFDIQKFLAYLNPNGGKLISLGKAAEDYLTIGEMDGIYEHRSVDDAMLTMLVAKKLLEKYGFTLLKAIEVTEEGINCSKGLLEVIAAERNERKIQYCSGHIR